MASAYGDGCLYQVLSLFLFFIALVMLAMKLPYVSAAVAVLAVWMFARGYRRARQ